MPHPPLDILPLWLLLLIVCTIMYLAMEGGYRGGEWRRKNIKDEKEQPVAAIVASILGLWALILGFTFSLAATRFEARRQVVLDEANAIGTTHLRSRMLPAPHRDEVGQLLREYVDVRIKGAHADTVEAAIVKSEQLHEQIWQHATAVTEQDPHSISTGLFVQSLNEMIDLHAKRLLVSLRSRIPFTVWLEVGLLSIVSIGSVGYQAALSATRRSPVMIVLIVAFASVLYLIADLDRGQEGLLRVSQQALIDTQKSMQPVTE